MLASPGHDGNPPVLEELLDRDGRGKRDAPTRLHRYDTVGWLFRHGHIESHHEQAARKLQADTEQAELGRSPGTQTGFAGGRTLTLSDHKIAAMARHASARASLRDALGPLEHEARQLVELVVIGGKTLKECAAIMGQDNRGLPFVLRVTLGILARHYRLA